MAEIRDEIRQVLAESHPQTDRQIFYQLTSRGVVAKTEKQYHGTVVRLLSSMRLSCEIPFEWIADSTRWMRKPKTHASLQSALRATADAYRRALWDDQGAYVEIWLEKDALSGVLYPLTSEWDVPLMVTRGYASLSFLHHAALTIDARQQPAFIYYLGDYDPSGLDISRSVESRLREFAPHAEITFARVAVTRSQIDDWGLPTRPTKRSDSRSNGFVGESVEVDAIPADVLRLLVTQCISNHVDVDQLAMTPMVEQNERDVVERIVGLYEGGALQ
jgi:hypothetical protein